MTDFKFDAFISYRRSDGAAVARWLRRELESFRPPKSLRAGFGRKLRVYVDTAYEVGTSDFYESNIKPALLSSRFLLVVATPNALIRPQHGEDWIEREVRDFATGAYSRNVVAIRGAGEFDAPLPAGLAELFPNVEVIDLRGAGRFWFLHPTRAVRLASEKLKLAAPLLGIPAEEMPRLRQEEERRQQTRLGALVGATLGILLVVSGLSVFALISRNQAIRAADDAMFAAGGMALRAADLDQQNRRTARIRRLIINQGCDLVDKFRAGAGSDPQIAEIVMCRLERGRSYEDLNEDENARGQYREAIALADARYRKVARADAALALLHARKAYAEHLLRKKNAAEAEAELRRLIEESRKFGKEHEGWREIVLAEARAFGMIGDIAAEHDNRAKAADAYDGAAEVLDRYLKARTAQPASPLGRGLNPSDVAWLARLRRLAGRQHQQLGADDRAIARFHQAIAARGIMGEKASPAVEYELLQAQVRTFEIEHKRGRSDAAGLAKAEALKTIGSLSSTLTSQDALERITRLKKWLESKDANK